MDRQSPTHSPQNVRLGPAEGTDRLVSPFGSQGTQSSSDGEAPKPQQQDGLDGHHLEQLPPGPTLSGRIFHASQPTQQGPDALRLATWRSKRSLRELWVNNKPVLYVASSQLFGSLMNLSARFLELESNSMHPTQMLLLRQSITSICCLAYMWIRKTPGFPFGRKDVRSLLLLRGCTGFFGIFGMWWSMMYLPLADATVITFLAPGVAGFACYYFLKEPFTLLQQVATFVALMGVVLIAQPAALFAHESGEKGEHPATGIGERPHNSVPGVIHETTPQERLIAVGVALLGVFGAAGAFTTLRALGKRAHPLISVNAFAVISTLICSISLALGPLLDVGQPSLHWVTPSSAKQWLLLLSLGVFGFLMQYCLTAGLGADKSNRANSMVYTQMLYAVSFDRWIFGHRMSWMSFAGCTLILGSAIGVILTKKPPAPFENEDLARHGLAFGEAEGSPMLRSTSDDTDFDHTGHADADRV